MWEARYLCYINNTTLVSIGHRANSNIVGSCLEILEQRIPSEAIVSRDICPFVED